jgi:hypothetical protein
VDRQDVEDAAAGAHVTVEEHCPDHGAGQQHGVDHGQEVAQHHHRPHAQRLAAVAAGERLAGPPAQPAHVQRVAQEVDPQHPAAEVQPADAAQQRPYHRDAVQEQEGDVDQSERRHRQEGVEHIGEERHLAQLLGPGPQLQLDPSG